MLSRLRLVWPRSTASPNERCRIKCFLSSRDVKSTCEKARVVIFPSRVMANVAITNGRLLVKTLLGFADLVLQGLHFSLHFAQTDPGGCPAWAIKEINHRAGSA